MNRHIKQCHKRALATDFEAVCLFGVAALTADLVWLTHDIVHNGMNVWYFCVGTGLLAGTVGTAYVLIRRHINNVRKYQHNLMVNLCDKAKRKAKRGAK